MRNIWEEALQDTDWAGGVSKPTPRAKDIAIPTPAAKTEPWSVFKRSKQDDHDEKKSKPKTLTTAPAKAVRRRGLIQPSIPSSSKYGYDEGIPTEITVGQPKSIRAPRRGSMELVSKLDQLCSDQLPMTRKEKLLGSSMYTKENGATRSELRRLMGLDHSEHGLGETNKQGGIRKVRSHLGLVSQDDVSKADQSVVASTSGSSKGAGSKNSTPSESSAAISRRLKGVPMTTAEEYAKRFVQRSKSDDLTWLSSKTTTGTDSVLGQKNSCSKSGSRGAAELVLDKSSKRGAVAKSTPKKSKSCGRVSDKGMLPFKSPTGQRLGKVKVLHDSTLDFDWGCPPSVPLSGNDTDRPKRRG
jgi:hypothetical protein